MPPRSIRRLVAGSTALTLTATLLGVGAAAPVAAQDPATKFANNAINAMPKKAQSVFDLMPVTDPTGDVPVGWLDIDVAAFDVGVLDKQAANFLNNRPGKAGEWWAANQEPFQPGDVVLAFAARTVDPWPEVPGGVVWTVGQDGPGAFGIYGGGYDDPFSGNVVIDNFGLFDNDGTFFPGGGRTDLTGLALGGTPDFYDMPGGAGYRKGRNSVAFLPVSNPGVVLNMITKPGQNELNGASTREPDDRGGEPTFNASLQGTVDGQPVFDHLAPGDGQYRHFLDGSGLPAGLECYSVAIYPYYEPGATTADLYDIEVALGFGEGFDESQFTTFASTVPASLGVSWHTYPDVSAVFGTASLGVGQSLEELFLPALGVNALPVLDPLRAGFGAGDPYCATRDPLDIGDFGPSAAGLYADQLGLDAPPDVFPVDFPDMSDALVFQQPGADEPFSAFSIGRRPFSMEELQAQIARKGDCFTTQVDVGEGAFVIVCGERGADLLALVGLTSINDQNYRFALELLTGSSAPPAIERLGQTEEEFNARVGEILQNLGQGMTTVDGD